MSSMTTNRLGAGPAATAAAHVPDLHHFRGSYGGKDVIPLYRDSDRTPNADPDLLDLLSERLGRPMDVSDLFAYSYGLLAGTDYTTRFLDELETPGPRVPLTAEAGLFTRVAELGGHLLWLHTFGERFTSAERTSLVVPDHVSWDHEPTVPPEKRNDWEYHDTTGSLLVGGGSLGGVRPEVWAFEVSGMRIVEKWLNYRTVKPPGRAGSGDKPLDAIRPSSWHSDWSLELRELVWVLDVTLDYIEAGTELLTRILAGPLIPAGDLPPVPDHLREVPDVNRDLSQLNLDR